jgi:hypothetical protein
VLGFAQAAASRRLADLHAVRAVSITCIPMTTDD